MFNVNHFSGKLLCLGGSQLGVPRLAWVVLRMLSIEPRPASFKNPTHCAFYLLSLKQVSMT